MIPSSPVGLRLVVPLISDLRFPDSGELAFPPCHCTLDGYAASLCEPEQVDAVGGPAAIVDEMGKDGGEGVESWCRVGMVNKVTEWIERGVPLVRLFIQERYSVSVSAMLNRRISIYALFWRTKGKGSGLW